MMTQTKFCYFNLTGEDAAKFLQGQITADVNKISQQFLLTAICNLKGRVDFGFWIAKQSAQKCSDKFVIVLAENCADDLVAHIKKYGAFSNISLSAPAPIGLAMDDGAPTFSHSDQDVSANLWLLAMIKSGQSIITQATRGVFQPQELRLHQLGGVHYDKGCYLGQEVVARLWFKAAPKAWLHLVSGVCDKHPPVAGEVIAKHIQVVNATANSGEFLALVVARPQSLECNQLVLLNLPSTLSLDIKKA